MRISGIVPSSVILQNSYQKLQNNNAILYLLKQLHHTSAIFVADIREPPDVTQADHTSYDAEQELKPVLPVTTSFLCHRPTFSNFKDSWR